LRRRIPQLALKSDGTIMGWGAGFYGIGHGNFPDGVAEPVLASSLGHPVSAIAAGGGHSLALPGKVVISPQWTVARSSRHSPSKYPLRIVGWFQLLATDNCDPIR